MNRKQDFLIRYIILSLFSYALVLTLVEKINHFIQIRELAISFSFLLVYGLDFIATSLFVFRTKLNTSSLIRFLSVTIFFFGATFSLSKFYLIYIENVFIVTILTGLTLAPVRYLASKKFVYDLKNSLLSAFKDSIGEVSRNLYTLILFFDTRKVFCKKSKYPLINYLKSLLGFQNATLLMNLDLPWWPFAATHYVEKKIGNRQISVFEWGSGASTVWLSRRAQHVVSVEHDNDWAIAMAAELEIRDIKNVSLRQHPALATDSPKVMSGKKGFSNLDFFQYTKTINAFQGFDLIVIDGRARVDCWEEARHHLNEGGFVVFDNWNRNRYKFELDGFRTHYFSGLTPASIWPTHTLIAEKL
jgi:hypothetical protein